MQSTKLTIFLSSLAATAHAGTVNVLNNCSNDIHLTITGSDQVSNTLSIASGTAFSETISGQGNSFGITQTADYFSPNTPKLIWGFSDAPPTLYYSLNFVDGNAFDPQDVNLSFTDPACGTISGADGRTRTCGDGADFTLALC